MIEPCQLLMLPVLGLLGDTLPTPAANPMITIAICQIVALDGDREGNFTRIEAALDQARTQGADIACFPETTLLGWVNPDAHHRSHPIPGPDTDRLATFARRYGLYICAGVAETDNGKLYDAAVLIDPHGDILLKHRKINILTHLMDPPYTPGQDVQVAQTPLGAIGLLICADSFLEPVCLRMRDLNPDLVLIPYGWAADETDWPQHGESLQQTVRQAAQWINATVIGTDLVGAISHGPWKGKVYGGQSTAAGPNGQTLTTAKDRQPEVHLLTLEP